jgi:spore coat protein U-like protein
VNCEFINHFEEVISMLKPLFRKSILMGASLLLATAAQAAGNTFNVTATVLQTCSVSVNDLNFGSINVVQNQDWDSTTTISLTCGSGLNYNVGLDAGLNGGTVTTREMMNNGVPLDYALYQDTNRTTNWGNSAGVDTVSSQGTGSQQTLTVYGRVPNGQTTVGAGTYSDTVTVYVYY